MGISEGKSVFLASAFFAVILLCPGLVAAQTNQAVVDETQVAASGMESASSAIPSEPVAETKAPEKGSSEAAQATGEAAVEAKAPETITLDFKEADIKDVLKIISYKSGVNIVASPEVTGTVNVRIVDVPWEKALDVILKSYGYAYDRQDNIIMVAPLEKLTAQRKMEQDLAQVQPVVTEVLVLQYIDASDAKKAIEAQLSPRGRVTVLDVTGQAGWGFGGAFSDKRSRGSTTTSRSRTLIISDIPPALEKIKEVVRSLDTKPRQILIETRLVEVSLDKLKDIGFDYATGAVGAASSSTVETQSVRPGFAAGAHVLGDQTTPSVFAPKATAITSANTGLRVVFDKLDGTQFEVIFHALEENVAANVLSAPSILTLDNQEATILVGEQFPIVSTTKSSDTSTTVDVSLESYKDIGIQLNVVPQVSGVNKDYINMIIHPSVTSEGTLIENKYPRITTREAQTQVLMKSGETIMIGGLIKDVKNESVQGVPFLRKIPWIGKAFFERTTVDTEKIELVIFITAHIVNDKSLTSEQLEVLEQNLGLQSLSQSQK
jgi:type IV pilus assembly protein PilQ